MCPRFWHGAAFWHYNSSALYYTVQVFCSKEVSGYILIKIIYYCTYGSCCLAFCPCLYYKVIKELALIILKNAICWPAAILCLCAHICADMWMMHWNLTFWRTVRLFTACVMCVSVTAMSSVVLEPVVRVTVVLCQSASADYRIQICRLGESIFVRLLHVWKNKPDNQLKVQLLFFCRWIENHQGFTRVTWAVTAPFRLWSVMRPWFDFWFWHYILFLYIVCFPTFPFFLYFFLTHLLPYLFFPLRIDLLHFHARRHKRRLDLALVFFSVVVYFFWLASACFCCVRFSLFSIPSQEIGLGKRLQNDLFVSSGT